MAGYLLARRVSACRAAFDDPRCAQRSITDIALASGFTSPTHFSRVFRSHVGMSPSEYRHARAARAMPA